MSRSAARWLYFISLLAGAALIMLFAAIRMEILCVLTLIATVIGFGISVYFLRCPVCGWTPGKHGIFAKYCPKCGEYLGD